MSRERGAQEAFCRSVHSLHVRSICSHIAVESDNRLRQSEIIGTLEQMLDLDYHIIHTTPQGEDSSCVAGPVIQQLNPRLRKSINGHNHRSH